LQLQHLQVKRQRRDHHFKTAKPIVAEFDAIAVEDLKIKNLVRNPRLAKSICDAGWGGFLEILTVKAASAGREIERVVPAYTSQDCSQCGERMRLSLACREFKCLVCGFVAHRDHNAAINVRARARSSHVSGMAGLTQPSAPSGSQVVVPAPASEPRTDAEEPVVRFLGQTRTSGHSSRA